MTRFLKLVCVLCFASVALAQPVFASALENGRKAYLAEKYTKAKKILMPLAVEGDAKAQELIAIMYDFGHGVDKNQAEAIRWYEKSAAQGNVTLQHDLGIRYFKGDRVEQDYAKAASWWRLAAESGVAESQYNLGLMLTQGLGIEQDPVEAVSWYEKAAGQNHPTAQYSLGIAYAFGQGVAVDYENALAFFSMAAKNGVAQAQYNLGVLYEKGRGTDVDHDQAEYWFRKAASKGLAEAKQRVARMEQIDVKASSGIVGEFESTREGSSAQAPVQSAVPTGDSAALVRQLSKQLQAERSRVASLSSEVTNNLLEIERLQQQAKNRSLGNTELDLQLSGIKNQLIESQKRVAEVERQLAAAAAEKERVTGEKERLNALMLAARQEQDRLQGEVSDKQSAIERMQSEIEQLQGKIELAALGGEQQQRLQQEYASVNSIKQHLEQDLADAQGVIAGLRKQLELNEKRVMEKLDEVERMEAASERETAMDSEMALKIETFSGQLDAYREQVAALKNQLTDKEMKEREMRAEIRSLAAAKGLVDSALSSAQAVSANLKQEIAGLGILAKSEGQAERELGEAARRLESLTAEQLALEQELVAARARGAELQTLVDDLNRVREGEGRQVSSMSQERDLIKSQLESRNQENAELLERVDRLQHIADRVAILEAQQADWDQERTTYSMDLAEARDTILALQEKAREQSSELPILSAQPQVKISRYTSFAGKSDWGRDNKLFTEIHHEDWIKNQEPRHYLLQLITLPNQKLVDKFFDMYPLQEAEKAFFVSKKRGKDAYNIVYGVYSDRNAALRGLENLPEGIRKKGPLVRDYESVQRYFARSNR